MNWAQFKDPVSHMFLAGAVVASWSLAQEAASGRLESFSCNDIFFVNEFAEFSENI